MEPLPYLSFWQVAEKWSKELRCPVIDVIMDMKRAATYPIPTPPGFSPPLLVHPILFISPQGQINEHTFHRATRTDVPNPNYYCTDSYKAGVQFLNSGECPVEVTTEIQEHLSQFGILREDFGKWCSEAGRPMPKFWGLGAQPLPPATSKRSRRDALEKILIQVVPELRAQNSEWPTVDEVYDHLKKLSANGKHKVIQEVKRKVIFWTRDNGREDKTPLPALKKRLKNIQNM